MIISSKDDVVQLSGQLHKNQWLTIKATAGLLLKQHPEGILIDCSELTDISEDGAKTFLDAMRDIEREGSRIILCALPANVLQVIRTVPGVRSQLPIANSVEEARSSLRLSTKSPSSAQERTATVGGIVVPILPELDVDYAVAIAGRLAKDLRSTVHLVYFLEVARNLPLATPLPEEETTANRMLEQAIAAAKKHGLMAVTHLERVRDVQEGVLHALKSYHALYVVLGAFADRPEDDLFHALVDLLLHRAPCNVLIGRKALPVEATADELASLGRS